MKVSSHLGVFKMNGTDLVNEKIEFCVHGVMIVVVNRSPRSLGIGYYLNLDYLLYVRTYSPYVSCTLAFIQNARV